MAEPIALSWQVLEKAMGARRILGENHQFLWAGVSTDSRSLQNGQIFIALEGENFDGHDFIEAALARGAVAVVVATEKKTAALAAVEALSLGNSAHVLVVENTLNALQQLAAYWRQRFNLAVIAICGSNGKTTVKEMVGTILADVFNPGHQPATPAVLVSAGNQNNHIGVPLTLLRLQPHHRVAVVEIGMNHSGEIVPLAALAKPSIALVNNAQREHQEFLQGIAAAAEENGQVFQALPPDGVAVYPLYRGEGAAIVDIWRRQAGTARQFCFALVDAGDEPAPVPQADRFYAHLQTMAITGSTAELVAADGARHSLHLPLPGRHFLHNALAAISCCHVLGVSIADSLRSLAAFTPVKGRMTCRQAEDFTLIDDSYNANPDSVRAAIDTLALATNTKVLVLGDMGEVGADNAVSFHREVGDYARRQGIDHLLAMGSFSRFAVEAFGARALLCRDHIATVVALCELCQRAKPLTILVKGSRFMQMEKVVAALLESAK